MVVGSPSPFLVTTTKRLFLFGGGERKKREGRILEREVKMRAKGRYDKEWGGSIYIWTDGGGCTKLMVRLGGNKRTCEVRNASHGPGMAGPASRAGRGWRCAVYRVAGNLGETDGRSVSSRLWTRASGRQGGDGACFLSWRAGGGRPVSTHSICLGVGCNEGKRCISGCPPSSVSLFFFFNGTLSLTLCVLVNGKNTAKNAPWGE
jgi:hypothetical protein